jgi:hypothetical protein
VDVRRYRAAFDALAGELGGEAALSASQRMIIDQIAKLQSRRHPDSVRVANTTAKLLIMLKAEREQRQDEPSALSKYLATLPEDAAP